MTVKEREPEKIYKEVNIDEIWFDENNIPRISVTLPISLQVSIDRVDENEGTTYKWT